MKTVDGATIGPRNGGFTNPFGVIAPTAQYNCPGQLKGETHKNSNKVPYYVRHVLPSAALRSGNPRARNNAHRYSNVYPDSNAKSNRNRGDSMATEGLKQRKIPG